MTHDLKIWPEHFDAVASGRKRAEVRRCDDRTFAVGDSLILREWAPSNRGEVGPPLVVCSVCGLSKHPWGRDAAASAIYCADECPGHRIAPHPSPLWPGESREDFGFGITAGAYTGCVVIVRVTHVLLGVEYHGHPAAVLSFEVLS